VPPSRGTCTPYGVLASTPVSRIRCLWLAKIYDRCYSATVLTK
jgi:hypothetical protein